jgi:hypothetical protein
MVNPVARAAETARQITRLGATEAALIPAALTGRPALETGTDILEDVGGVTTRYFISEWDLSDGTYESG